MVSSSSLLFAAKQLVASTRSVLFRHTATIPRQFSTNIPTIHELIRKKLSYTICITLPDGIGSIRLPDGKLKSDEDILKDMNMSINVPGNYEMKETPEGGLSFFLNMGIENDKEYDINHHCAEYVRNRKALFVDASIDNKIFYSSKVNLPPGYDDYKAQEQDGGLFVTFHKEKERKVTLYKMEDGGGSVV